MKKDLAEHLQSAGLPGDVREIVGKTVMMFCDEFNDLRNNWGPPKLKDSGKNIITGTVRGIMLDQLGFPMLKLEGASFPAYGKVPVIGRDMANTKWVAYCPSSTTPDANTPFAGGVIELV